MESQNEISTLISSLVAELQEDRKSNARIFSDLSGAIREQGAQIKNLAESNRAQWDRLEQHGDGIAQARAEAQTAAKARVWSKETREAVIQIIGTLAVVAGLISGPVVTLIHLGDQSTRAQVEDKMHNVKEEIDERLDSANLETSLAIRDSVWRDNLLRWKLLAEEDRKPRLFDPEAEWR